MNKAISYLFFIVFPVTAAWWVMNNMPWVYTFPMIALCLLVIPTSLEYQDKHEIQKFMVFVFGIISAYLLAI